MTLPRIDRRTFALGGASAWLAGCGEDEEEPGPREGTPTTQRVAVAVVGAGLAGLHCAWRLRQASVDDVHVYEAQSRVGGRLLTARNIFVGSGISNNREEAICELGAEFVGSFDATMHALARELGIVLDDVSAVPNGFTGRSYISNGVKVEESKLREELEIARPGIVAAVQSAGEERVLVDNTTLESWISKNLAEYPNLSALLPGIFRTEFGVEPSQLSALHLLSLAGDPSDSQLFQLFNRREPRYRAARGTGGDAVPGMDQFATKMRANITTPTKDPVHLDRRLRRVLPRAGGYTLVFEGSNGQGVEIEAEHVVFAIPFSVLRDVDLSALPLSRAKREIIAQLGYGTSAKFAGLFGARTWREHASTGAVIDDGRQLWDATLNTRELGVLAAVVGGKEGLTSGANDADAVFERLLPDLEVLFPEITLQFRRGSAVRVNWPAAPFARGSASAYRPGQWAQRGTEGRREGGLHFCGEHCSLDFAGRLEGAAETGALAAAEILEDLDVRPSPTHAAIINLKRGLSQSYFEPVDLTNENLLDRVKVVTETHRAFVAALGNPSAG
jgi:monoamine oxidase